MFCKCEEHIKRKPLAEFNLKESIDSFSSRKRYDHSYCLSNTVEQENKRYKTNQYTNEFGDHNYCSVHNSDCIAMKKPITVHALKKALSEKEDDKLHTDSDSAGNNNNRNTEIHHQKVLRMKQYQ